jgi:hypothetical protein
MRVPTTRLVPDVRAGSLLGLSASVSLDRALERTIRWHQVR